MSGSGADGLALALHGEEVGPREDPFTWPHPMDPHEALFIVDDTVDQARWVGASQSHEGVLVTLSKLVDAAITSMELGAEIHRLMTEEVTVREQVRFCCPTLSFELAVRVIPSVGWCSCFFFFL